MKKERLIGKNKGDVKGNRRWGMGMLAKRSCLGRDMSAHCRMMALVRWQKYREMKAEQAMLEAQRLGL